MRVCVRCHQERSADDFYKSNRSWCKACVIEYERARRAAKRGPREVLPPDLKRCPMCLRVLDRSQFRLRDNGRPYAYCDPCWRRRNEQYRRAKIANPRGPLGSKWASWRTTGVMVCPKCGESKSIDEFQWIKPTQRPHGWCRPCVYEGHKRYLKTEAGKAHLRRYRLTPERQRKNAARDFTRAAIKLGILVPQPCEVCGVTKVHAHHDDYGKPLEIRWLCQTHHTELHRAAKMAALTN